MPSVRNVSLSYSLLHFCGLNSCGNYGSKKAPAANRYSLLKPCLLLLIVFLVFASSLYAEGTKEVMPNSTNGVALSIAPNAGTGPYRGADPQYKVRFYITNAATENFYFGYRAYERIGPTEVAIYYRIVDAAGTQVVAPVLLSTAAGSTGRITSYTQAVAGPNISGLVPTGYSPLTFDPSTSGEYSIELYTSTDGGATASLSAETILVYFDFTVATTTNTKYPGRVYCQAWNLIAYNPTNFAGDQTRPLEGDFYAYTADSSVVKLDLNAGFKPLRVTIYLNRTGIGNSGNWDVDRKSLTSGLTAPTPGNLYSVFLNLPDVTLFARSAAPTIPTIGTIFGCPGFYSIPYQVNMPGDVGMLLDMNGVAGYQAGTADRYLSQNDVTAGSHILSWNGLNGLGAQVAVGTTINITFYLRRGRTNVPLYDAELNQNGLSVAGVSPSASNPYIFWDDSGSGMTNTDATCDATKPNGNSTGIGVNNSVNGSLSPAHAWDGTGPSLTVPALANGGGSTTTLFCDDFGNVRTLNSWFWSVEVTQTSSQSIIDCALPLHLIRFNANQKGSGINLNWTTSNESSMKSYVVERSPDGINFAALFEIAAKNGQLNEYSISDTISLTTASKMIHYRLKQIEQNGNLLYSPVVVVRTDILNSRRIQVIPKALNGWAEVTIKTDTEDAGYVTVSDVAGRIVVVRKVSLSPGLNQLNLGDGKLQMNKIYGFTVTTKTVQETVRVCMFL